MPDHRSILKSFPRLKVTPGQPPTTEMLNVPGRWNNSQGRYVLSYNPEGKPEEAALEIEGARLTITGPGLELAFVREG